MSAESMSDFLAEAKDLDEEAFSERYPYPFLVKEATKGHVPVSGERSTARLTRSALATVGDGFGLDEGVTIHRVYPRREDAETVRIGRDKDECDVVISDGSVSNLHAEISLDYDEASDTKSFLLSDLGSANGTFLNGDRLEANTPLELSDMDSIRLGPVIKLQFFTSDAFFQFSSMYRRIKKP